MSTDQTLIQAAANIMAEEVARDPDRYPHPIDFEQQAAITVEDFHEHNAEMVAEGESERQLPITPEAVAEFSLEELLTVSPEYCEAAGMTPPDPAAAKAAWEAAMSRARETQD